MFHMEVRRGDLPEGEQSKSCMSGQGKIPHSSLSYVSIQCTLCLQCPSTASSGHRGKWMSCRPFIALISHRAPVALYGCCGMSNHHTGTTFSPWGCRVNNNTGIIQPPLTGSQTESAPVDVTERNGNCNSDDDFSFLEGKKTSEWHVSGEDFTV